MRDRLRDGLPALETLFLDISHGLEPLSIGSAGLVSECERLLQLASGREDGQDLMRDTLAVLQGPLDHIDLCLDQRGRLIELLSACERRMGVILGSRSAMHDTLAPLSHLATLFKIESARLPADLRSPYVTVTIEIERMRRLVDETFAKNATLLGSARSTLSGVRGRLDAEFEKNARELMDRRGQIETAIRTLDDQLRHNNERDLRMQTQSRVIAAEVARMVEGLQFQDIIQQKCAHVIEALAAPDIADSAPLQAGQLEAVLRDLDGGGARVREGLANITRETDRFDEICLKLDGLEGMVASADGMVQMLLEIVQEMGGIMQVLAELTEHANHALGPMAGLAETLTSTVVELSIDMRHIALNAQIRSIQNGEGTGLEVLAARTAEISAAITELTGENYREIGALREGLAEMIGTFGRFRERSETERRAYGASRAEIEGRLHGLRDRTLEAFGQIGLTLETVRSAGAEVSGALARLPEVRAPLAAAAADLARLAGHPGADSTDAEVARRCAARYTMASEHAVHASVAGGGSDLGATAGVELFDMTSAPGPAVSRTPAPVSAPPSKPASRAPVPAGAVAGAPSEFGDNAELF